MMLMLADIELDESLQTAIDNVAEFVPKLIGAIVILIIGWIIAVIIRKVVVVVLKKVNFDGLVDRSGLGTSIERAGYPDAGELLAKFLYYAVMLLALQLAISSFGPSAIQDALDALIALIPKIVIAAIIVVITGAVANAVKAMLEPALETVEARNIITKGAMVAIWIVGGFAAIDQLGVAESITQMLFATIVGSLGLILVIKFGVGGIWAARDRFWPAVYDKFSDSPPAGTQQSGPTSGGSPTA